MTNHFFLCIIARCIYSIYIATAAISLAQHRRTYRQNNKGWSYIIPKLVKLHNCVALARPVQVAQFVTITIPLP